MPNDGHAATGTAPEQRRKPRLSLLIAPFACAATLLIVPFLIRKPVEVRADLIVKEVSFTCEDAPGAALLGSVRSDAISIREFQNVRFATGHLEANDAGAAKDQAWRPIATTDGGVIQGNTNSQVIFRNAMLDRLVIPQGAKLSISWNRSAPSTLSLSIEAAHPSGEILVDSNALLECEQCSGAWPAGPASLFRIAAAREHIVKFRGGPEKTGLWLNVSKDRPLIDGPVTVRDDIRFLTKVPEAERLVSSIIAEGRIAIPELSKERKVHSSELFAVGDAANLRIVSLTVNDGIHVSLSGTASTLRVGEEGALQNIAPSLLEWAHARSPFVILGGDIVVVGTAILSVLTRMRIVSKD